MVWAMAANATKLAAAATSPVTNSLLIVSSVVGSNWRRCRSVLRGGRIVLLVVGQEKIVFARGRKDIDIEYRFIAHRPAGMHRIAGYPADRAARHVEHLAVDFELQMPGDDQDDLIERVVVRFRPLLPGRNRVEGEQRVVAAEARLLHEAVEAVIARQVRPPEEFRAGFGHNLSEDGRWGGRLLMGGGSSLAFGDCGYSP